jgi:hypothetical protein
MMGREARMAALYLLLAGVSAVVYLGASRAAGSLGFPLDDAWIHQTYARNLGLRGEFAFVPGQLSSGSTSPLWSGVLAVGYALRIDYRAWTFGLGAGLLSLNAWLVRRLVLGLWPAAEVAAGLAGALAACEWHLVWSAVSGMETLLYSAAVLAVFVIDARRAAAWIGAVVGLSILARPDGLALLPFALVRVAWIRDRRGPRLVAAGLAFGLIFGAYLLLNQVLGGTPWPNTFYAKQAEYAVLTQAPLVARWVQVAATPFIGVTALLLPGLAGVLWRRRGQPRNWATLWPLAWMLGLLSAYALRLPVTYQHGRYFIPVIPIILALGVGGLEPWLRPQADKMWARVISRAWLIAGAAVAIAFWVIGAQAYGRDVQIIETEMVATAHWVNEHTEAAAIIAAHDIGALGYFGGRGLVDLAGLVSPEVIPFIRDEARLRTWLDQSAADYLVTFPGWYPSLVLPPKAEQVFETGAPFSPAAGGENMAVYQWNVGLP